MLFMSSRMFSILISPVKMAVFMGVIASAWAIRGTHSSASVIMSLFAEKKLTLAEILLNMLRCK
jgi:hypothetical protein